MEITIICSTVSTDILSAFKTINLPTFGMQFICMKLNVLLISMSMKAVCRLVVKEFLLCTPSIQIVVIKFNFLLKVTSAPRRNADSSGVAVRLASYKHNDKVANLTGKN